MMRAEGGSLADHRKEHESVGAVYIVVVVS